MALMSSRRGAAESMALPLMILTFVAIGGFMFWLSRTAEPTQVAVVEEGGSGTPAAGGGTLVGWNEFGANPQSYEGQTITLRPVRVASLLGQGAFWTQLPNETPFLIKLGATLVADGLVVASGDVGELTGTVHTMSDSVLNAWQDAGVFTDDVQRIEAEFATSFLEAEAFAIQVPEGG